MRYKALGMGNGEWGIGKKLQMYLTLYENRYSSWFRVHGNEQSTMHSSTKYRLATERSQDNYLVN
ncbi:MAG: hypothetical protein Fur006_04720 [Coleofasciculaceae cyanobacterium]